MKSRDAELSRLLSLLAPTAWDRIEKLLLELPIPEDRRFKMESFAHSLVVCGSGFFKDLDDPNSNESGTDAALRSLETFAKLCDDLGSVVATMPAEAITSLEDAIKIETAQRLSFAHPVAVLETPLFLLNTLSGAATLREWLARYAVCARHATKALAEGEYKPSRRGRHKKQRATATARLAVFAFEELTGTQVTRRTKVSPDAPHGQEPYGPFLKFLASLFGVLEIKASAESQARIVLGEKWGRGDHLTP